MGRKPLLFLFDLDGVLIEREKRRGEFQIFVRPHAKSILDRFLVDWDDDKTDLKVGFYTSMYEKNAEKSVAKLVRGDTRENVFKIFGREYNEEDSSGVNSWDTMRSLEKVWNDPTCESYGFGKRNTVLIDDEERKVRNHSENAVVVSTYDRSHDEDDEELVGLEKFLDRLIRHWDLRDVRKYLSSHEFEKTKKEEADVDVRDELSETKPETHAEDDNESEERAAHSSSDAEQEDTHHTHTAKEDVDWEGLGDKYKAFIGGLPWSMRKEDLQKVFEKYGTVVDVMVAINSYGKSRGFGFVQFSSQEALETAVREMQGKELLGRPISVNVADPRGTKPKDPFSGRSSAACYRCGRPGHLARECMEGSSMAVGPDGGFGMGGPAPYGMFGGGGFMGPGGPDRPGPGGSGAYFSGDGFGRMGPGSYDARGPPGPGGPLGYGPPPFDQAPPGPPGPYWGPGGYGPDRGPPMRRGYGRRSPYRPSRRGRDREERRRRSRSGERTTRRSLSRERRYHD